MSDQIQEPQEMTLDMATAINDSFTITLLEKAMIADLIARGFGRFKSEIVRDAIRAYHASKNEPQTPPTQA